MSEYMEDKMYIMLNRVRQRPGMWIGKLDIERMKLFINGYRMALRDLDICQSNNQTALFPLDFSLMSEFVKIKTNAYSSEMGWAKLILEECNGDREKALDLFFEYYDEFCVIKAVRMKKSILTKDNIFANDNMLYSYRGGHGICRKSPIYDSPQAVYLIELSNDIGYLCAVETSLDIQLKNFIFRNDQMVLDNKCWESPVRVFGSIDTFEEIPCEEHPVFLKPIRCI